MRAVNLASRPFVNRRPVIRIAGLLWLLAIGIAAVDIWQYGDFFRTAASHRSRLADLEQEIGAEQERTETLRKRIEALKLDEDNATATYLNGLIHQRIFPWSRLFDDIEDVLPKDVYLTGLSPQIEKVEKVRVRRTPTRATRARSGRNAPPPRPRPVVPEKDLDRVAMMIEGYSRTDEAMLDLVDRLYASPTFLEPNLSSESRNAQTGLVHFRIAVTYLTRVKMGVPGPGPEGEALAEAQAGGDATLAETLAAGEAGRSGAPVAGSLAGRNAAPGPAGRRGAGEPAADGGLYGQPGFTTPGAPAGAGRPATRPGFDTPGAAGTGGTAQDPRGGRRAGQQGGTILQPGFANPDLRPQPGEGGVVVPPRNSPTPLRPVPSATPGLRGGG